GKPVAGAIVSFVVTEKNAGVAGTCTTSSGAADPECKTDENGEVDFTYSDVQGVGKDTIVASVTLEFTIEEKSGELPATTRVVNTTERATATEEWTPPPEVRKEPALPKPTPKGEVLAFASAKLASNARACIAASGY